MLPIVPRLVLVLLFFLALALPSAAKEESKIKVRMVRIEDGGGARGDVRTQMSADSARLHLKVHRLESNLEHTLICWSGEDEEEDDDGVELARFTTGSNGAANLKLDLLALGLGADADPRGRRLSVNDGTDDVLEVWIFPDGDSEWARGKSRVHAKEWTDLAPGPDNTGGDGSVGARYQVNPNGKGRLLLALRGVPAGSYAVYVNDRMEVDEIVPKASGNAQLSFRTGSKGKARSKLHNKKLGMGFDPYLQTIELRQGDKVYYSGVMAAQVEGLNVCDPDPQTAPLTALQPGDHAGSVTTDFDGSCHAILEVEVSGTGLPGSLDLYVDEQLVDSFSAPGSAEFDAVGASGVSVRIDDGLGTDYFEGTLP